MVFLSGRSLTICFSRTIFLPQKGGHQYLVDAGFFIINYCVLSRSCNGNTGFAGRDQSSWPRRRQCSTCIATCHPFSWAKSWWAASSDHGQRYGQNSEGLLVTAVSRLEPGNGYKPSTDSCQGLQCIDCHQIVPVFV